MRKTMRKQLMGLSIGLFTISACSGTNDAAPNQPTSVKQQTCRQTTLGKTSLPSETKQIQCAKEVIDLDKPEPITRNQTVVDHIASLVANCKVVRSDKPINAPIKNKLG